MMPNRLVRSRVFFLQPWVYSSPKTRAFCLHGFTSGNPVSHQPDSQDTVDVVCGFAQTFMCPTTLVVDCHDRFVCIVPKMVV
jgi:hypothetical protein